jgi:uroporphyrinogen-III synthase
MVVLSTKILTEAQKNIFQNSEIEVVDYDAISIEFLDFEAPHFIKNGIFTSQNSVRSIISKNIEIEQGFCVGEKTRFLLEKNDLKVIKTIKNASELAHFIQKNYKNEVFYFFSGTRRRDEIPDSFKNSKNTLFEIKTYKTELNTVKFEQKWSGILFFSPTAVQSYVEKNVIANSLAFCIGQTTADEAKLHTKHTIYIADDTTVESVIKKTINTLKND